MLPIPFLSAGTVLPTLPGAAPAVAPGAVDFAALLPPGVAPVTPRQGHAEGGKPLPASMPEQGDPAGNAATWITPPLWHAITPVVLPAADGQGAAPAIVTTSAAMPAPSSAPRASASTPVSLNPGAEQAFLTSPIADSTGAVPDALQTTSTPEAMVAAPPTRSLGQPSAAAAAPAASLPDNDRSLRPGIVTAPTLDEHTADPSAAGVFAPGAKSQAARAQTIAAPGPAPTRPLDQPGEPLPLARSPLAATRIHRDEGRGPVAPGLLPARGVAQASDLPPPAPAATIATNAPGEHTDPVAPEPAPVGGLDRVIASPNAPAAETTDPEEPSVSAPAAMLIPQRGQSSAMLPVAGTPASDSTVQLAAVPAEPAGTMPSPVSPPTPELAAAAIVRTDGTPPATIAPGESRGVAATGLMLDLGPRQASAGVDPSSYAAAAPQPEASPRPTAKNQPALAVAHVIAPQQPAEPAQPARIAPAAQVFAAAIHQAVRDERRIDAPEPALAAVAPATGLAAHAVTAADSARQPTLDMARDTWPAKMIERIEMIRDAIDAVDTSIRLVPDKLGTIDVSLKRDGDTVQVHFAAQQPETRQLLADAQPKLTELAEAKGLKLSAQTGDAGGGQQQQRAPTAAPHSTTRPSRGASNDDAAALADERIA